MSKGIRIHHPSLGRDIWLAEDEGSARDLEAEFPGIAVFIIAEVLMLEGAPAEILEAVARAKETLPGARVRKASKPS